MRKWPLLLLLSLLVFNTGGYRIALYLLEQWNEVQTARHVEQGQFDSTEIWELKLPVTLPYTTDWPGFERVNGTVQVDGIVYRYVEMKYEKGYITYRCLPDHGKTALLNAREAFLDLSLNFEQLQKKSTSTPVSKVYKVFHFDFFEGIPSLHYARFQQQPTHVDAWQASAMNTPRNCMELPPEV